MHARVGDTGSKNEIQIVFARARVATFSSATLLAEATAYLLPLSYRTQASYGLVLNTLPSAEADAHQDADRKQRGQVV